MATPLEHRRVRPDAAGTNGRLPTTDPADAVDAADAPKSATSTHSGTTADAADAADAADTAQAAAAAGDGSAVAPTAVSRSPGVGRHRPAGAPERLDDDRTIRRLVFDLAWPVIVENLLQTAVGVVDLLMVSRLGAAAIAAVGVSVQVLFVIMAAIAAIATGTTVLIARFTGAGERDRAAHVAKQSVVLAVALGVLLAVGGIPGARPLVALLGAEPEVVQLGGAYLEVTFLTAGALTLSFVLGAALRGAGDSRTPMLVALGVNVVNVVVAYALIFGHLGLPALGVVGSAWGAAAGRAAGALALLVLVVRGVGASRPARSARAPVGASRLAGPAGARVGAPPSASGEPAWELAGPARVLAGQPRLRLAGAGGWWPDAALMARLLRIGLPSMGEQLSRSLGMLAYSTIIISLGTAVFAAQRITFSIISLSFLPGFGFSMAATALTGQALGARKPERARRATWFAARSAAVWMGSMGLLFLVAAPLFMRVFTADAAIVDLGAGALRVLAFGQLQMAIGQVLAGGLRGAGDTRFPMANTSANMWLLRLPMSWFFTTRLGWGLPGAYGAFVVGSTVEALASFLRFRAGKWQRLDV